MVRLEAKAAQRTPQPIEKIVIKDKLVANEVAAKPSSQGGNEQVGRRRIEPGTIESLVTDARERSTLIFSTFGSQLMDKDRNPQGRSPSMTVQSPSPTFSKRGNIQTKDDGGTGPGDESK